MKKLLVIICFLVCASWVEGATYYIKNGGNDALDGLSDANAWETIGKISATSFSNGDIIQLKRGSVFSDDTLELITGNNITIQDYDTGAKPFINGDVVMPIWIHPASTISNLTIKNIDISGQDWQLTKDNNLQINNVSGVTIDGVIGDGHYGGNTSEGKTAIYISDDCNGDIVVTNCTLYNWGPTNILTGEIDLMGIVIEEQTAGTYTIANNTIHDIAADGVHLVDATVTGVVSGNTIYNCGENGIDVKGSSNVTIISNEFYREVAFTGGGGSGSGTNPHVNVHNGYTNSISYDCVVDGNYFHDGDASGVVTGSSTRLIVKNNRFENIKSSVFCGNPVNSLTIANNVIVNPVYRLTDTSYDSSGIYVNNGGTNVLVVNNTIINNTGTGLQPFTIACMIGAMIIKNNIVYQNYNSETAYAFWRVNCGAAPTINNNYWYNPANNVRTRYNSTTYSLADEAAWKASYTQDDFDTPDISTSTYIPNTTSPVIKAGVFVPGVHDQPGCKDMAWRDCNSMAIPIGAYMSTTIQPTMTGYPH